MKQQAQDYANEFDLFVADYNNWLKSLENKNMQKRNKLHAYIRGIGSVLNIFNHNPMQLSSFQHNNPLYLRKDLTSEQRTAVSLASDLKRVCNRLDKILLGKSLNRDISVENAGAGKLLVASAYNQFKNIYVSHALR